MSKATENLLHSLRVVLPVESGAHARHFLPLALALTGEERESSVQLLGVNASQPGTPLTEKANASQHLKSELDRLAREHPNVQRLASNPIFYHPWEEIKLLLENRSDSRNLLMLPWQTGASYLQAELGQMLLDAPCNVVVGRPGAEAAKIRRILLPVRGGAFANLSLQLAVRLARSLNAEITLLRVLSRDDDSLSQILRERFIGLSDAFPEITTELQVVGDARAIILRELKEHQAVILGASAVPDVSLGLVANLILQREDVTVLVAKTKEPFRLPLAPAKRSNLPVLIKVERWFAENTYHSREFADLEKLLALKRQQGVSISLGLPAFNEEATIGKVIRVLKKSLMDELPLLDEIVLIDSHSTDATRRIAAELGVTPFVHQDILSAQGSFRGKGEALWKSLYLLKGDIILWMDTDITNPHPRFVYGILGPLLNDPQLQYVKGFYKRPMKMAGEPSLGEGGRVTELLARPIINLFFPELSGVVQPLAGIYGGRRRALEQLPFYSGYGVEIGLLLEALERFGLRALAQVDLEEVAHRNQQLRALSKMSFAILQVFAEYLQQRGKLDSRLEIERTMKVLRSEEEHFYMEEVYVHDQQRPPMIEVKEYRGRHRKEV